MDPDKTRLTEGQDQETRSLILVFWYAEMQFVLTILRYQKNPTTELHFVKQQNVQCFLKALKYFH